MYVSTNGNSTSASDPNFIHFPDEQTGLLLPNIPGYPDWLPNLQLTKSGRLCFWNFPNVYPKALVSNPANIGTKNYLMNGKIITGSNPNPPVPADLGVNGSTNQYFWNSCVVRQTVTPALYPVWNKLFTINVSINQVTYFHPGDYIMANIQFYLNRYLTKPYLLFDPNMGISSDKYPWPLKMMDMQASGQLQKFLMNCNFLINLGGGTDFVDDVDKYAPVVGAAILALATAGAGTPALTAALAAIGAQVTKTTAAQTQANAQTSAVNPNLAQIQADVGTLSGSPNSNIIFIIIAVIIVLLLIIFYKRKK